MNVEYDVDTGTVQESSLYPLGAANELEKRRFQ